MPQTCYTADEDTGAYKLLVKVQRTLLNMVYFISHAKSSRDHWRIKEHFLQLPGNIMFLSHLT